VENFETEGGIFPINSPRSLEACLRLGLNPAELFPKSKGEFFRVPPGAGEELVQVAFDHHEKQRRGARRAQRDPTLDPTGSNVLLELQASCCTFVKSEIVSSERSPAPRTLAVFWQQSPLLLPRRRRRLLQMATSQRTWPCSSRKWWRTI
jgi:hypothetical protein